MFDPYPVHRADGTPPAYFLGLPAALGIHTRTLSASQHAVLSHIGIEQSCGPIGHGTHREVIQYQLDRL